MAIIVRIIAVVAGAWLMCQTHFIPKSARAVILATLRGFCQVLRGST